MRIFDLAFMMVVFHGSLLIAGSIDIFGDASYDTAIEFNRDTWTPNTEIPSTAGEEGSFSFMRRGLTMVFGSGSIGFLDSLSDVIFLGSTLRDTLHQATSLILPGAVVTMLNGLSGFIYSLAAIQLFLRFKAE